MKQHLQWKINEERRHIKYEQLKTVFEGTQECQVSISGTTGKLTEHLNQVDKEAREKVEMLVEQMADAVRKN